MATKMTDPKYVDILDEDKPLSGQKYVCVSFLSPEKILKNKEMFMFNEFVKEWDLNKSTSCFLNLLNFISHKYNIANAKLMSDYEEFIVAEKEKINMRSIEDDYKTFMDMNEERLFEQFNKDNAFQTSVRGVKIRGTYSTQEEGKLRAKMLSDVDKYHDIYIGEVGKWLPWNPEPYKIGDITYNEEELNQLMHERVKNDKAATAHFDERVLEAKREAIKANIENAKKHGTKITQNIDKEGNLYTVAGSTSQGTTFDKMDKITSEVIEKEMFDGNNISTSKSSN